MLIFKTIVCLWLSWSSPQKHFVSIDESKIEIKREASYVIVKLPFRIDDGLHIQDFEETKGNVLPSEVRFQLQSEESLLSYKLEHSNYDTIVLDKVEHKVLSGDLVITAKLKLTNLKAGKINGELFYQACNDKQCFFPRALSFSKVY